jgi:hypothetical protein
MAFVLERKNRRTGLMIELWDNRDQSLTAHDGDENWYTICTEHAQLVCHDTRKLAEYHMAAPDWCEVCTGADETGLY